MSNTATISTAKRNNTSIPLYKRTQIVGAHSMLIRLNKAGIISDFNKAVALLNAYEEEITPKIETPSDTCERCGGEAGGWELFILLISNT